jgi:uncharacterized protein (TIGR04255 family)
MSRARFVTNQKTPDFDNPPVVEVACSIQFEPVPSLSGARLGLLWGEFRDRYPNNEQQRALSTIEENLDGPPAPMRVRLDEFNYPRQWFLNKTGTRLIQVQRDRFVVNWRKLETTEDYPRYSAMLDMLSEEYSRFVAFLKKESIPEPTVTQCELTYVNHIPLSPEMDGVASISTLWAGAQSEAFLPRPEAVGFQARYLIAGSEGVPVGRLYVESDTGVRLADQAPIFVMNFVARGRPFGSGLGGAVEFLNLAHDWVVRGFASVTSKEMHASWRRRA